MRIVSPLLKRVLYPALSAAGAFRRTSAAGLAVVTYHGVLPRGYEPLDAALDGNLIRAETLHQQLRLLKSYYNVISPEEVLAWTEGRLELPARAVLVTCDDGLLNCLTDMLPVLQQEGVSCLFFVTGVSAGESRKRLWYEELLLLFLRAPAGRFDISAEGVVIQGELGSAEDRRKIWWGSVKRLSQVNEGTREAFLAAARTCFSSPAHQFLAEENSTSCRRFGLLARPELLQLASAGMTIGAHTMSHPMLSQMASDAASNEISECRTRLESVLGRRVWAFAYPFGDQQSVTLQVLEIARQTGYSVAFLNFGGGLGTELPHFALPRVHVTVEMSLSEFEAHVSGFYAWLQRLSGEGRRAAS